MRVVDHQINPGAFTFASGANKRRVVTGRREPHLEQGVRQRLLGVHIFIEIDEAPAHLESLFKGHRELELLMQVIDCAVESLVALHHQIGPPLSPVRQGGESWQPAGVRDQVCQPRRRQRIPGN